MKFKLTGIGSLLLAMSALLSAPSVSRAADIDIDIGVAPPAPMVEEVPGPRSGQVWIPGHWSWREDRHVGVRGPWGGGRVGSRWMPARGEQRGPRWHCVPGHWER